MRTVDQWLALGGDKLPVELARVFVPKPWKHDWKWLWPGDPPTGRYCECRKCENGGCLSLALPSYDVDDKLFELFGYCDVPDPVDIKDWNVAKYWQGQCAEYTFLRMAQKAYKAVNPHAHADMVWASRWLATLHKLEDARLVLIIAAMAVEREK